ncbi:MAG: glycine oxidase ThiO [Gammaproteobacteria bacterium]
MFDTIIVGAGAIGMMSAYFLTQQGQSVCLLDKSEVGTESSWAGGGILSPLYPWRYSDAVNDLARWSQLRYPEFLNKLNNDTGIDCEHLPSGLLIRNIQDQKPEIENWLNVYNNSAKFVSEAEAHEIEPLTSDIEGQSLWLPDIGQVRNPRLVKALHKLMVLSDIPIKTNCEVLEIKSKNKQFTGIRTSTGDFTAGNLVIASGAWSGALLQNLSTQRKTRVDINPVRGQMMIIKTPPNTLKHIILDGGHYLIPRKDGRILIGSTLEFVGFDKSTTEQAHDDLLKAAISIAPDLAQYPVEFHWAGLRPGTTDGIPYICKHPEISGFYINSGHYRNGIILGLASAQLLSDIMLNKPPILNILPYQCPLAV